MKSNNKIVLIYTGIIMGIIMISFILFGVIISYQVDFTHDLHLLFLLVAISFIILLISGISIFFIGKRYLNRVSERINQAFQREKSFISNASHEVNNPLTAIQGECEISLMKERTPGEYQAALKRIAAETKRMILLMKHLLFLAQGEKEMLNNTTEPIQLANMLMEYAQGRVHFSMDNFALTIEANRQLIKMALDNLIGNACKYSNNKPVYLDLRGTVLEVIDNGIGIPEEELRNINQPFYRATNARDFSGNGIGLSLAIRILTFYGAKIEIRSKENEGTTISIDFQQAYTAN
ncbi:HAMP domain-containing sensor histidine kinase [Massilibacteroides sp.]|uniref:sensor histidine kinase n=1 Tax=Massilibacteroides sp. TaxID=2034766 RepID=UPI002614C6AB|nr:HAMP domain-containing sensor histidine kinase [Massilibacteroides sp.]MDD4515071.1 HAMP domain-containing sensor histidine kinase [Massilibacteroides sp.]